MRRVLAALAAGAAPATLATGSSSSSSSSSSEAPVDAETCVWPQCTTRCGVKCDYSPVGSCAASLVTHTFPGCAAYRGSTECFMGKCLCQEGFCASADGESCEPEVCIEGALAPRYEKTDWVRTFFNLASSDSFPPPGTTEHEAGVFLRANALWPAVLVALGLVVGTVTFVCLCCSPGMSEETPARARARLPATVCAKGIPRELVAPQVCGGDGALALGRAVELLASGSGVEVFAGALLDPVEGVSTPEQLLERWGGFVGASSRLLARERAHFSARHRKGRRRAAASASRLGERPLAAGACASARALAALAASLRAARACAAAAPPLCQALARFGEAARAEPAEATSQVPAALIAEFAELLPALADARRLLDRVAEVAEHLVRQLVGFQGASSSGRELGQLPVRPVLDALGDVLAVAATMDGVVLENQETLRNAHLNFSWIVSKASGGLLELPPEAAVQLGVELREAEPLMRGDAFRACTARAAEGLAGLATEPSGLKLREEALAYFATRLKDRPGEELASSGPSSGAQRCLLLALPSEALVPWVCAWVLFASAWEPSRSDARLMADVFRAHKRSPFLVLFGRVVWCVGEFLQAHLPGLVDSGLRRDLEEIRGARGHAHGRRPLRAGGAGARAQGPGLARGPPRGQRRRQRRAGPEGLDEHRTLLRGLVYARRLRAVLEEYLVLHVCQGVPVPRRGVEPVGLALRLLKAIEAGRRAPQSLRQALDAVSAALHEVVASPTPELAAPHLDAGSLALCCAGLGEAGGSALGSAWRELGM
ncbi:unnamed protein product, partial [Prorocentrum cordatum]